MKSIKSGAIEAFHVISEPGDGTRYDYYVIHNNHEDFICVPAGSTFRFPGKLNYYDIRNINTTERMDPEIIELAGKENCNPYTLKECIRTIIEIWKEKNNEH